jgi:hypothetical protein
MINSENKKEPFHASFDIEFSAFEKEFGEHFYFKKTKPNKKK